MIGNDVVDLQLAARESNWRRKGFLEKVFSEFERGTIATSSDQNTAVWLLWSMKEAAYKAHQREFDLPVRLNWQIQQCKLQEFTGDHASGEVEIEGEVYYTASEITSEYIYTSAEKEKISGVENAIFEASSSEAKGALIKRVADLLALHTTELKLQKDAFGMPFLSLNNSRIFNRFSLSAHGRFSAYMLSLINCETTVKHS